MPHASEIWAPQLIYIACNAMTWMCGGTTKDQISWQDFLERMQLDDLEMVFRTRWLRWYGYV